MSMQMWEGKVLYRHDTRPDNYVDTTFLHGLQRNANIHVYTVAELMKLSWSVVRQVSLVVGFVGIFVGVWRGEVGLVQLTVLAYVSTVVAYGSWVVYMRRRIKLVKGEERDSEGRAAWFRAHGRATIKNGLIFTLLLMLLSPVFRTLTEDTSADTVWASSAMLLVACLVFNDYGGEGAGCSVTSELPSIKCQPLSLNCAVLAAITLASRLPTHSHVFALLSLAVNLFAFFPVVEHLLQPVQGGLTVALLAVVLVILYWMVSPVAAMSYVLVVVFISVGCPWWLSFLQCYKNTLHGPWDEAVLK